MPNIIDATASISSFTKIYMKDAGDFSDHNFQADICIVIIYFNVIGDR